MDLENLVLYVCFVRYGRLKNEVGIHSIADVECSTKVVVMELRGNRCSSGHDGCYVIVREWEGRARGFRRV